MPTPTPVLSLAGLTVKRGNVTILDQVSWTVLPRQHWIVLGANGCGKTSLLKTLLGYLSPSAGTLSLLGRDYGRADWRELRPLIGIVTSALHASIPAAEPALETVISGRYAQLDLWAPTTRQDAVAARRLLVQVGGESLVDRPWAYLSQGERQRVLIARALMARPRLLILDEPCAGLDPVARAEFLAFVDLLARQQRSPALILVTHHVEEITPAFTHALGLRQGRVHASGPLASVVNSRVLSALFDASVRVRRSQGRYQSSVTV
ncbi:MAG: ABC transporter ATP-binding protein [Opitutaceae bacterium]